MNRITLISFIFFSFFTTQAQNPPNGTRHIKYTDALKLKDGDTIEFRRSFTYYDSSWRVLENTSTLSSVVNTSHKKRITEVSNDTLKIYADIDKKGDTTSKIIYKYDEWGNRTEYYQVLRGDTVNRQRRTYDQEGNNLTLYNYKNGKYYLRFRKEFNEQNEKVKIEYFSPDGYNFKTIHIKRKERRKKKVIKRFESRPSSGRRQTGKTVIKDGVSKSINYKSYEAINYGVEYNVERGGYSERKEKNDNLVWWKLYDRQGNLTTSVHITYEDYP